jgi:hypothetical protein
MSRFFSEFLLIRIRRLYNPIRRDDKQIARSDHDLAILVARAPEDPKGGPTGLEPLEVGRIPD